MVLANQLIPPPGASSERAVRGRGEMILLKLIIGRRNKFICKLAYFILVFDTPHSIVTTTMDLCPSHAPRWSHHLYLPPYANVDLFWLVVVCKIIDRRPSKAKVCYNFIFFIVRIAAQIEAITSPHTLNTSRASSPTSLPPRPLTSI